MLKTKWGMGRQYAQFTPNQAVPGCWAVAIAQILYDHRIQATVRRHRPHLRLIASAEISAQSKPTAPRARAIVTHGTDPAQEAPS
jgi:hypothetical protein